MQIQTSRKSEPDDVKSEMGSLARVIKEVENDQVAELLAVLNEEQYHPWNNLCGALVGMGWKMGHFLILLFKREKRMATNSGLLA